MEGILKSYQFLKLKVENYKEHFIKKHGVLLSAFLLILSALLTVFCVLAVSATVMLVFSLLLGWI